ncbi:MAG: glycosyl transferase family 2, partial [Candidatus Zixiibacteriota bacterium]
MTDSPEREKQPAAESASSEPGSSAAGSTSGGWPKLTLVFSTPGDFSSLRRILGEICEQDYPLE